VYHLSCPTLNRPWPLVIGPGEEVEAASLKVKLGISSSLEGDLTIPSR